MIEPGLTERLERVGREQQCEQEARDDERGTPTASFKRQRLRMSRMLVSSDRLPGGQVLVSHAVSPSN